MPHEYDVIFDALHPVTFKYNDGTSGRIHMGMIAQEVEGVVNRAGVSTDDFAAICVENEQYSLRYGEFVAMCIDQIQKLKKRVEELENKLNTTQND
jgi:ubiquinone biosynthesis protein UbiJ